MIKIIKDFVLFLEYIFHLYGRYNITKKLYWLK